MAEFVDPHGAPEIFCTELAFIEFAAPGIVRFGLMAEYPDAPSILRVKVLLPITSIPRCIGRTNAFLLANAVKCIGAHGAVLM